MDIQRLNQQSYVAPQKLESTPRRETSGEAQVNDQVTVGGNSQEPAVPKKWTILHYTACDNNLTSYMVADVNEMERVGSTKNMNLISMLDQGGDNCKIYYIQKDDDMSKINSPVIKDMGNTNTADPKVIAKFIIDMMEQYPAENYAVILSDHGAGWVGAIEDEGHHSFMTMPMIREALEEATDKVGKKIDVLGFDACLMATGEVGHELKDVANYYVASQEVEGAAGWPYTPLLTGKPERNRDMPNVLEQLAEALDKRLDVSPEDLAKRIVQTGSQYDQKNLPTLSALDLTKMDKYEASVNDFAKAIIDTNTPNSILKGLTQKTQSFYYKNLKDQFHFAKLVAESGDVPDPKLKEAANNLMKTMKEDLIIANENSPKYPNAHGVSIELPSWWSSNSVESAKYQDLTYAKATLWDEAVAKFMK